MTRVTADRLGGNYLGVLELLGLEDDGDVVELLGLEDDGCVLELGVVDEFGVVGELGVVGEPGEVGDVEDDGELDLTELRLLGCVGVFGDVADDELLLFGVDCAPGAMDIRGPRCGPFGDELDELFEGD